jgi:DNA-binding NtrC family response regulator
MQPQEIADVPQAETQVVPKHILVVDDERHVTLILKRGLERLSGVEVSTAANGRQALDTLAAHRFDMLITDQSMPGMSGLDLAGEARRLDPDIVIVFVTAFNSPDLQGAAESLGVARFLNKPMRLDEIRQIVRELLKLGSSSP